MSIASVGKSKSKASKGKAPSRGKKAAPAEAKSPDIARILVSRIQPDPDQPRRKFDWEKLGDLAESLKSRGQLQPIRVRWSPDLGSWLIVSGERRWRAANLAGLKSLDCVVAPGEAEAREVFVDQLVENLCREDLGPLEEARGYARVIEARSCSAAAVAALVGKSRSSVSRSLALLDLPAEVLDQIEAGELAPSTALAVGKVEDPAARAEALARALGGELTRDRAFEEARASADRPGDPAWDVFHAPKGGPEVWLCRAWTAKKGDAFQEAINAFDQAKFQDRFEVREASPGYDSVVRKVGGERLIRTDWGVCRMATSEPICRTTSTDLDPGPSPSPSPSKALPDWRDRPAMGLDLPAYLAERVAESGIETAGELWGLLETGYLVEGFGWTVAQAKALESVLVRLRHEAGDPDGFTAVNRVTGRGGPSHGATLPAPDPAPPEGWHRAPLVFGTLPQELILGRVEGLEVVARSKSGPRSSAEVLAALRRAVELAEAEAVEAPDPEAPAPMQTFEVVEKLDQKMAGHIRFQATSQAKADEHCRESWPKLLARPFDPSRPVPKARPARKARTGKVRPGIEVSP